jgi:hypothetical protein
MKRFQTRIRGLENRFLDQLAECGAAERRPTEEQEADAVPVGVLDGQVSSELPVDAMIRETLNG